MAVQHLRKEFTVIISLKIQRPGKTDENIRITNVGLSCLVSCPKVSTIYPAMADITQKVHDPPVLQSLRMTFRWGISPKDLRGRGRGESQQTWLRLDKV